MFNFMLVYVYSVCAEMASIDTFLRSRSIPTVVSNNTKKCQYHDNQSPEDGSRANSRNVVCIKYTLDQWFPNGVSRHPGVSGGTTRCVAKLKEIYLN
jgi:hypothetical protein